MLRASTLLKKVLKITLFVRAFPGVSYVHFDFFETFESYGNPSIIPVAKCNQTQTINYLASSRLLQLQRISLVQDDKNLSYMNGRRDILAWVTSQQVVRAKL